MHNKYLGCLHCDPCFYRNRFQLVLKKIFEMMKSPFLIRKQIVQIHSSHQYSKNGQCAQKTLTILGSIYSQHGGGGPIRPLNEPENLHFDKWIRQQYVVQKLRIINTGVTRICKSPRTNCVCCSFHNPTRSGCRENQSIQIKTRLGNDRGETTSWVWETTGWSSRLQEHNRSVERDL